MSDLRRDFQDLKARVIDAPAAAYDGNEPWAPVMLTREEIDAEIDRLASMPKPPDGRRISLIVHPKAPANAPGLAPGIQVALVVLKPGEETHPFRHNATEVSFCIRGRGHAVVGDRRFEFGQYDVWNTPSHRTYSRINHGTDIQACLVYSNAPLLKFMQVYLADADPASDPVVADSKHVDDPAARSPFGTFKIGDDGAMLMPYETLINPPAIHSPALYWPWARVQQELGKLEALGADYIGRRLYLLYNPMTTRTNGTTPNFFATITIRPPHIIDRPHRHVSSAINYYFKGRGYSSVGGNIYHWKAGDLMLSAPGWTVHNHASEDEVVYELTVQDQPLNIAMESLLWQESLKNPPILLGTAPGFVTNRQAGR